MIAFIEDQRVVYGVESICRVLPIAPSTYYHRLACLADPSKASARHQRDTELRPEIKRVWDENYQVYGVRKAWHQLKREGFTLARCTVDRLMKQIGIRGAVRGKVVKTTVPDTSAPCPRDKVNRVFRAPAPNLLWVSDFTYVSTWQGFVYVAFVIDTFADRIVGWRVSRSARTDFVLDALEQALHDRRPVQKGGLVHHSDRGGQYLSIRYTERLAEAGIEPSVGSVGDSYDNALAETINGLYKTELVHRQGPWRNMQDLEMATLGWGRLVQQQTSARAHRKHPASRGRRELLCTARRARYGRVKRSYRSPKNPGRFRSRPPSLARCALCSASPRSWQAL